MHKFYEDLKVFILNQDQETKKTLIPYYETLLQLESYSEMKELLNDYTCLDDIEFVESDNGWLIGTFEIHNNSLGVVYKIHLELGNMSGSYCECSTTDELYNIEHDCCGNGCDFYAPRISITKEISIVSHDFQGYARDLWALEEKWTTDYEKEALHKKNLEKALEIEAQIERLQNDLRMVQTQL
ncbi:hypothetical protein FJQ98_16005 [Lysinibacillus agricola]|uniref:Uncharacterized protein n=1 Tax=Lysinibacillus agricola TaxID=2590012 RepID=A0ABX7ALQ1_9BACI|nr:MULTISPECIES: hypothetical protein [Lysinibacillus]QQP10749.1 hypothetical protein FJQ98_16005 [Lysinibacillus agricola]